MLVFTSKALFSFEGSVLFQLRPRNARAMEAARFSTASLSPFATGAHRVSGNEASVSLEEWQGWGSTSPVPAMVLEVIEDLKLLEKNIDAHMDFGGNHGKLVVKITFFLSPTILFMNMNILGNCFPPVNQCEMR